MDSFQETRKKADEILEYAELMEDELGEALTLLCDLHWRSEYLLSDKIKQELAICINEQYEYLKKYAKIVESEETISRTIISRDIEWTD